LTWLQVGSSVLFVILFPLKTLKELSLLIRLVYKHPFGGAKLCRMVGFRDACGPIPAFFVAFISAAPNYYEVPSPDVFKKSGATKNRWMRKNGLPFQGVGRPTFNRPQVDTGLANF
jgi:hypothetical protein